MIITLFYASPTLSLINSPTPFPATSGKTLTTTNSRTAYARCLLQYASPNTSSIPLSTSAVHTARSGVPNRVLQVAGGRRERRARAHARFRARMSEEEGAASCGCEVGEGEGWGRRVLLGKRVWRVRRRRRGRRVGGWRVVRRRWWMYLLKKTGPCQSTNFPQSREKYRDVRCLVSKRVRVQANASYFMHWEVRVKDCQ